MSDGGDDATPDCRSTRGSGPDDQRGTPNPPQSAAVSWEWFSEQPNDEDTRQWPVQPPIEDTEDIEDT